MRNLERSPGQGRGAVLNLSETERSTLDEVSALEMRLGRIRAEIVSQARLRSHPPRNSPIRNFMR
jgi:hypothetical protein